jgi:hypothetical protein
MIASMEDLPLVSLAEQVSCKMASFPVVVFVVVVVSAGVGPAGEAEAVLPSSDAAWYNGYADTGGLQVIGGLVREVLKW